MLQEAVDDDIDWDERYAKCKTTEDFNLFWDGGQKNTELKPDSATETSAGYFDSVWGEYAEKIRGLGKAFLDSVKNFGFDPKLNPIIAFLMKLRENNILSLLDHPTFVSIVNALNNGKLTAQDLKDGGKFGEYNIIFNKNFYRLQQGERNILLKEQDRVKRAAENIAPNMHLGKAFANIYSVDGKEEDLGAAISAGGKLRNAKEIARIVSNLLGVDIGPHETTSKEVEVIIKAVNDNISCNKLISYLFDILQTTTSDIPKELAADSATLVKIHDKYRPLMVDIVKFKSLLGLPKNKYTTDKLVELLAGLLAKLKTENIK